MTITEKNILIANWLNIKWKYYSEGHRVLNDPPIIETSEDLEKCYYMGNCFNFLYFNKDLELQWKCFEKIANDELDVKTMVNLINFLSKFSENKMNVSKLDIFESIVNYIKYKQQTIKLNKNE